jgi:electron transfer flavoprotein alpha/beta subunit
MFNIVVCVKAVPDPKEACNIKIDPHTKTLLRCDVPLVCSVWVLPRRVILLRNA